MKLKLRQVRYNPKSEALFLIFGSATFCGILLYMILTGVKSPVNAPVIIGFIFFGTCLLIGIWQLLKKKTVDVVNLNGWQYRLFKKGKKFRFILISGFYKLHFLPVVLFFIWFIRPEVSVNGILWYIACGLIILVILIPLFGYLEYKKFSSMANIDDEAFIFPKDKNSETDVL
jgi:hypothetical protein